MITQKEWDAFPERKLELQKIMGSPLVQEALFLVKQKRIEDTLSAHEGKGAERVADDSAAHNESKGWFGCLKFLESLYTAKTDKDGPPQPEPYADDYAEKYLKEKENQPA